MKKKTVLLTLFAFLYWNITTAYGATVNLSNSSNGSSSTSIINFNLNASTSVVQGNDSNINNVVNQDANTGGNKVKDNFGDIDIQTGDIESSTAISNSGAVNDASIEQCCTGELEASNTKNGADSTNTINYNQTNGDQRQEAGTGVYQANNVNVSNDVDKKLNTGDNKAYDNHGDVEIETGNIDEEAQIGNKMGGNTAYFGIGGFTGAALQNEGNGRDSDNNINVDVLSSAYLEQINNVWIHNNVNVNQNTGGNECRDNFGDCVITTGDIQSIVVINNETGINDADIDDCCEDEDNPTPTLTPTPTDKPNGGPMPDDKDLDVESDKEIPGGNGDIDEEDPEKSIIEKIIEMIVPKVRAADDDGTVLGAMDQLPLTGMGELPYVSWMEVLIGAVVLGLGLMIRQRFNINSATSPK